MGLSACQASASSYSIDSISGPGAASGQARAQGAECVGRVLHRARGPHPPARMSVNVDPPRGAPPALALALAEAALQRQGMLLGGERAPAAPGPPPGAPSSGAPPGVPPPPPGPAGAAPAPPAQDAVHLSPQARSQWGAERGAPPGGPQARPAAAAGLPGSPTGNTSGRPASAATAVPGAPGTAGAAAVRAPWPATGVGAPLRQLLSALVQQLTAPAQPQRLLAVQPWPAALLPLVDGAAQAPAAPGLPPLQTWLVGQGVVQTAAGARTFSLALRVPAPWLQALPAAAAAATPLGPLAGAFTGAPQALQSGTWALVLQPQGPQAPRTSALLQLDLQPPGQGAAAATVYGRELLQPRQDPWLHMAQLQASGQAPRDTDAARERETALCHTPGCPYAGRAPCEQPFCLALRAVMPVAAARGGMP